MSEFAASLPISNVFCLAWFLSCWIGYSYFAHYMAKRTHSLSSVLHHHRVNWANALLQRDALVSDAALLANLERQTTFLGSTATLILAGLLAVIPNVNALYQLSQALPFFDYASQHELQLRFVILISIFVYAFFTFTWAMRQFGFCGVLMGAAPLHNDNNVSNDERDNYAKLLAKLIDQAGHTYNSGLRSYYFAMAVLPWFVSQWLFLASTALVVAVLYRREFHSKALATLQKAAKL